MNANLKNLFEKISTDEELRAKFEPIAAIEDEEASDAALIALAAEIGIPLSKADLVPEDTDLLDDEELNAVAGGWSMGVRCRRGTELPLNPQPAPSDPLPKGWRLYHGHRVLEESYDVLMRKEAERRAQS